MTVSAWSLIWLLQIYEDSVRVLSRSRNSRSCSYHLAGISGYCGSCSSQELCAGNSTREVSVDVITLAIVPDQAMLVSRYKSYLSCYLILDKLSQSAITCEGFCHPLCRLNRSHLRSKLQDKSLSHNESSHGVKLAVTPELSNKWPTAPGRQGSKRSRRLGR